MDASCAELDQPQYGTVAQSNNPAGADYGGCNYVFSRWQKSKTVANFPIVAHLAICSTGASRVRSGAVRLVKIKGSATLSGRGPQMPI